MFIKKCLCMSLLMLTSPVLSAFEIGHGDDWKWTASGFGTLGAVYSTDQKTGYLRDITQRHGASGFSVDTDTRFGLQTNFKWHELELVAQAVSRHRADNTYTPELMMAFAKFDPIDNLTVRAGRLLADVYMLSESRNIGYSYPTIRPPVDFLGVTYMNYFDGGDISYRLPMQDNFITIKGYGGHISESVTSLGLGDSNEKWQATSLLYGFRIESQWDDWKARIGFSEVMFGKNVPGYDREVAPLLHSLPFPQAIGVADELSVRNRWLQYYDAALSWSPSAFNADLGLSVMSSRQIALMAPHFSGFLNLSYRVDDFTPFFSFSWTVPIGGNQIGRLPAGIPVTDFVNSVIGNAEQTLAYRRRTFSLGLRYDITTNVDAKFQVDFPKGSPSGLLWENRANSSQFNGDSVVFGATIDFMF